MSNEPEDPTLSGGQEAVAPRRKTINVYFEGTKYPVVTPNGISLEQLVENLWYVFGLGVRGVAKTDFMPAVQFLNEDGEYMAVVPDLLEAGARIYVRHFLPFPSAPAAIIPSAHSAIIPSAPTIGSRSAVSCAVAVSASSLPVWDDVYNRDVNLDCYRLSGEGSTATSNAAASKCKHSMPLIVSKQSFTSGVHTFLVHFDRNIMYMGAAIIDAAEKERNRRKDFGKGFTAFPWFVKMAQSGATDLWFNLDMDRRQVSIRDAEGGEPRVYTGLPAEVWLAAAINIERECSVSILPA